MRKGFKSVINFIFTIQCNKINMSKIQDNRGKHYKVAFYSYTNITNISALGLYWIPYLQMYLIEMKGHLFRSLKRFMGTYCSWLDVSTM